MTEKLKDYQVLDVMCGGTFYKVRHKVTNNVFAWRAHDCSALTDERIQSAIKDVKTICALRSENLLRYYDTILHAPSRTLYFVLEYSEWLSARQLEELCRLQRRRVGEPFLWRLLLELARVCKAVEHLHLDVVQKCIAPASVFIHQSGELRVNCFELAPTDTAKSDVMRQVGQVISSLCRPEDLHDSDVRYQYSDDLEDVVSFLTDDKNCNLRPDVVVYHPTVLANLETLSAPKNLSDILIPITANSHETSKANKCDSEKVVELSRVQPAPRRRMDVVDSPIYINISPKRTINSDLEEQISNRGSMSPTIAALALELPGFVPRCRRPLSQAMESYSGPQKVSQDTFSQHWMSRLIALRQREESLNQRERDLIAKEIVNSPATKIILSSGLDNTQDLVEDNTSSNGITLPPVIKTATDDRSSWVTHRRRRATSVRPKCRRKSYAYEDLNSSLSADPGDESFVVTATKFTKENMPRRTIFPDLSTKKVHFTSANPFIESDDSVTLTYYELEDRDKGVVGPTHETYVKDITKFKYLDLEKAISEKRSSMQQWTNCSPSKQAKISSNAFSDVTNMRKTPSKTSLLSKSSYTSCFSSSQNQWAESSKVSVDSVSNRTRASVRQSLAPTPVAPADVKKSKSRKSLLPFKTPFKFRTSTKV